MAVKKLGKCRLPLSVRVLIPIIVLLMLLAGIRIGQIYRDTRREKQRLKQKIIADQDNFQKLAQKVARENLTLALTIAAIPDVQESIALEDRERLLGVIKPLLARIQRYSPYPLKVHFHLPPGVSFLRVWKPNKYGDDISGFRKTVVRVLSTGQPVYGIEPGRVGVAVRGVAPIFWEGSDKPVGSVEVFTSLSAIAKRLREVAEEENAIFWIKTVATTAAERVSERKLGRFWILLPAAEKEMALLDEDLLNKALTSPLVVERGHYFVSAVPVKDFQGRSIGVYVRFVDISSLLARMRQDLFTGVAATLGGMLLIILVVVLVTRISLGKPIGTVIKAAERVGQGDLDVSVPETGTCELQRMAQALNRIMAALGRYVLHMQNYSGTLREISGELDRRADNLREGSGAIEEHTRHIRELSRSASQEIQNISEAVEQFAQAIQEVVHGVNETSRGIEEVRHKVRFATERITQLVDSSRRIGEMVQIIDHIANQTNLLALNATIEAARAGEAGKGFAVVANEVKELARQTTEATETIRETVEVIQKEVDSAVKSIEEVEGIVAGVSEQATQMAGAAEEQSAVLGNIQESVSKGAEKVQKVDAAVEEAQRTVADFLKMASALGDTANELSRIAEEIYTFSSRFRVSEEGIRALEKKVQEE